MIYDTDGPTENWKFIFDLNVLALSVCTKEAIQSMKDRKVDNGHIIHINRYVSRRFSNSVQTDVQRLLSFLYILYTKIIN
jgi:NAD(P)-dependent dehydrogenase (short-subunit alcohol dehydrogenase family)